MFLGIYFSLLILSSLQNIPAPIQASVPKVSQIQSQTPTTVPSPTEIPPSTPTPTSTPQPTSTPVPTASPTSTPVIKEISSDYEADFDEANSKYGIDKNLLKRIATCESSINPSSQNGVYGGMFQFATQTWVTTRAEMGLDTNPDLRFSAKDSIDTAAFKISRDGANAWAGCL
jgi:hypothetical protein